MNSFKTIVKKKYLMQIFLYIMILMMISVVALSIVFSITSEKQIMDNQNSTNRKILSLIDYNINYMNKLIYQLGLSLYTDPDIFSLMFTKDVPSGIWDKIGKLQTSVSSNSFLESIVVYNSQANAFILRNAVIKDFTDPRAKIFNSLLNHPDKISKLTLIPVRVGDENSQISFFSSFLYESVAKYKLGESTLILNVNPEWLFNSIKAVNNATEKINSKLFILDSNNRIMFGDDESGLNMQEIITTTAKSKIYGSEKWKSSVYGKGKEKVVVDLSELSTNQWKVMIVQPYGDVFGSLYKIRLFFIIIVIVFLLITLLLTYAISLRLYKPIDTMVENIKLTNNEAVLGNEYKDELNYVSTIYNNAIDKLRYMQREHNSKDNIVQNYYLKKLITDSSSISREEYGKMVKEKELMMGAEFPIILCIVTIDNYKNFHELIGPSDKSLLKFAIINITKEIVSSCYHCTMVDIKEDQLVMLVNISSIEFKESLQLESLFKQAQQVVLEYYMISMSVAISESINDYADITMNYNRCTLFSQYKLVFGRKSVILPEMVRKNITNIEGKLPDDMQKRFMEAIRIGNFINLEEMIRKVFSAIKSFQYDCILQTIIQVSSIVKSTLNEMNDYRLQPILIDIGKLNQNLMELETLDEMCEYMINIFYNVTDKQKSQHEDRNDILIDTLKQLILSNYFDPNFSLNQISDMLKMSQVYIGRIFKKSQGVAIGEYIKEIRLGRSLELLRDTNDTIKESMEKVGYINESYFWRLFKKEYGITPKEYRMKMAIK